ncbi:hypothetical protein [Limnospira fusiformis]|uniref:hypothetical protein n=1 Tax=Limnospira fusiformis TaxID=54297 RepID=UPI003F68BE95
MKRVESCFRPLTGELVGLDWRSIGVLTTPGTASSFRPLTGELVGLDSYKPYHEDEYLGI